MSRFLVTGAGGFVGRALVPELAGAGHQVVAAVRGPETLVPETWAGLGVAVRPMGNLMGDLGPDTDWGRALEGVDGVVHLAARVHVMKDRTRPDSHLDSGLDSMTAFRRVNTRATRHLAAAAARAGVRRLVFISSVKAMGESSGGESSGARPLTEEDPPRPVDGYGISKWEAEQALARVAGETGLETVILRPPLVYGAGVKGNFATLLRLCRLAPPLPLGGLHNRRSLIYVGNLTHAIARCLEKPQAAGATYLVRDGDDPTMAELIRLTTQALGRKPKLFPVPPGLLRLGLGLAGKSTAATRLLDSLRINDEKIRLDLGWNPPFTMLQGLSETARWFLARPGKPHTGAGAGPGKQTQ